MKLSIRIPIRLYRRWWNYRKQNPVWTIHALVAQLLSRHFDEADAMLKSIEEQEQKRGNHE